MSRSKVALQVLAEREKSKMDYGFNGFGFWPGSN